MDIDNFVAELLETGKISFYIHPQHEHAFTGPEEVDHFFAILQPEGQDKARLLEVGRKKVPEVMAVSKASTAKHLWALVQRVSNFKEVWVYLNDLRGRVSQVAAGIYQILNHNDHIDLIFSANFIEPQTAAHLGLRERNGFIIGILNPEQQAPKGFPQRQSQPQYAQEIKNLFAEERFLTAGFSASLLDIEQTLFVLVAPQRRLVKAELGLLINEEDEQAQLNRLAA